MKNLINNKRGEVPVVILVIGVLAICALTIFSFYTSDRAFKRGFGSASIIDDAVVSAKRIELYREVGVSESDLEILFGIEPDKLGRYILSEGEGVSVKFYLP
ncbi:MAG: hypothetical protein KKC19_01495 [Nanoarchaeota archaeon]|nr:hypothetical protein [Nanoarchaeota archaeon]